MGSIKRTGIIIGHFQKGSVIRQNMCSHEWVVEMG